MLSFMLCISSSLAFKPLRATMDIHIKLFTWGQGGRKNRRRQTNQLCSRMHGGGVREKSRRREEERGGEDCDRNIITVRKKATMGEAREVATMAG